MQVLVQVQMGSSFERQSVAYVTGSLDRLGFKSWLFPAQTGCLICSRNLENCTLIFQNKYMLKYYPIMPGGTRTRNLCPKLVPLQGPSDFL